MQATKDNRLGTENITRLMISLAIPSVLAQIVNDLAGHSFGAGADRKRTL